MNPQVIFEWSKERTRLLRIARDPQKGMNEGANQPTPGSPLMVCGIPLPLIAAIVPVILRVMG